MPVIPTCESMRVWVKPFFMGEWKMGKATALPSIEFLKSRINFDLLNGIATWKEKEGERNWNSRHAGKIIGCLFEHGYVGMSLNKRKLWMHRIFFYVGTGIDPMENDVDHINGIKSDNRISNLRIATRSQNNNNQWVNRKNTSGYKGVYFNKLRKKWVAQVKESGVQKSLGYFPTKESAHEFLCLYRIKNQKEFANNGGDLC